MKKAVTLLTIVLFSMVAIAQDGGIRTAEIPVPEGQVGGFGNMIGGYDFDGDGRMEIYAVNDNWADGDVEVIPKLYKYEYDGAGTWELVFETVIPGIPLQNTWPALTAGDWDKDGKMEVIFGPVNFTSDANPNPSRIVVYEQGEGDQLGVAVDGTNSFKPNAEYSMVDAEMANVRPIKWFLTDIDNDGTDEIVTGDRNNGLGYQFGVISVDNIPDDGDGSETWTTEVSGLTLPLSKQTSNWDIFIMDQTIYLLDSAGDITPVAYEDGAWVAKDVLTGMPGFWSFKSAVVADYGDQKVAYVTDYAPDAGDDIGVFALVPDGAGSFTSHFVANLGALGAARLTGGASGDFDGDGNFDMVFGTRESDPNNGVYRVEFQGGDVTDAANYTAEVLDQGVLAEGGQIDALAMGDLDGDGDDEVMYAGVPRGGGLLPLTIVSDNEGTKLDVTFVADMSVATLRGEFDPSSETVNLMGPAGNWDTGFPMDDADGDTVYTVTVEGAGYFGTAVEYKLRIGADNWEGVDNRITRPGVEVPDTMFWNNVFVYIPTQEITVLFQVNMELERLSGRFSPNEDTVSVNGSFNGWASLTDILEPNPLNQDIYEKEVVITAAQNDTLQFKYWYTPNQWESVDNRKLGISEAVYTTQYAEFMAAYNDGTLETVLNQDCDITFQVMVENPVSAISGQAFSSVDNVIIAGSAPPLGWPGGGWPTEDQDVVHFLNDSGEEGDMTAGDNVWSKTLTFSAYTPINFQYKYGINFGLDNNEGGNDNENGVGDNHIINLDIYTVSVKTVDLWGVMGESLLMDEVVVGVEEVPGGVIPTEYTLDQNYPNPFNPSTTINFSIPESGLVTMKVFNILGQEVTTLINEQKPAGQYTVDFDASNLPSGVYIYSIQSGSFNKSMKMMLLK